ncbi:putative ferric-chelate reductase 1 [Centroberyx affinis]|uniref:putative ferric-chelate reductase 1 n=1 Tax=Centroberyx affinis TaxID=166261 RepID=UPI003A5C3D89
MLQKGSAPCITLSISGEVRCHTDTHTHRGAQATPEGKSSVSTADLESPGMDRGLILLVAALMIYTAPGVHGTFHLSFANNIQVNISRSGCGMTKLCVETPDDCDPMANTTCLFASFDTGNSMAPNGTDLAVQLRGDSTGFIALGLTPSSNMDITMVFICAQNISDSRFFFRTTQRNNSGDMALSPTERIVRDIRGSVNGSVIQCEFTIPNLNATSTRSPDTTFAVQVGSGTINGGNFGTFSVTLDAGTLNLADPASTIPPTAAPGNATTPMSGNVTTIGANTTAGSGAFQPHAVLVLLSVLTGSVMLRT